MLSWDIEAALYVWLDGASKQNQLFWGDRKTVLEKCSKSLRSLYFLHRPFCPNWSFTKWRTRWAWWSIGEFFPANSRPSLRQTFCHPSLPWSSPPAWAAGLQPPPPPFFFPFYFKRTKTSRSCMIPNLCGRRSTSRFTLKNKAREVTWEIHGHTQIAFFKWGLWGWVAFWEKVRLFLSSLLQTLIVHTQTDCRKKTPQVKWKERFTSPVPWKLYGSNLNCPVGSSFPIL